MNPFWITAIVIGLFAAIAFFILRFLVLRWFEQNHGKKWLKKHESMVNLVIFGAVASTASLGLLIHYVTTSARQLPKASKLTLNAARFLEDQPRLLDLVLTNQGQAPSRLEKAVFTVHQVRRLIPQAATAAAPPSAQQYHVEFDNAPTPYQRVVSFSQEIPPDRAERIQIELVTPPAGDEPVEYVFEFSVELHEAQDTVFAGPFLYMGNIGFYSALAELDPETQATLKALSESSQTKSPLLVSLLKWFAQAEKP